MILQIIVTLYILTGFTGQLQYLYKASGITDTFNDCDAFYYYPYQNNDSKDSVQNIDKYYAWSNSDSVEPTNWTSFNTGSISVEKKDISQAGTWYLWTKLTDTSNNTATEPSGAFVVREATIYIDTSVDKKASISYDTILTNNKKAGYGETLQQAKANASSNTSQELTFNKNGFVYAEEVHRYQNH